jgi:hypothetical protein
LSGVIETQTKPWLLLTFELPEADDRGGDFSLSKTPGRKPGDHRTQVRA